MSVQVEQLEGLKRCLSVVVPSEEVEKAYKEELSKAMNNAKVDGFRKGKVPQNIIEQRYGSAILQDVASKLIDSSFRAAIESEKLMIAGQPEVDLKKLEKNSPVEYSATFEVYPEISLVDLNGVDIEQVELELTDADEAKMIESIQKQQATWKDVDRASQSGDNVVIDFEGFLNDVAFDGGSSKDFTLELGSKQMIPGFEDQIEGMSAGEERDIKVTFPEAYPVEDLAGNEALFKITMHKVQEPELLPLDDEFAKKMGFDDGIDNFKTEMRNKMIQEATQVAKSNLKNAALDKLLDLNDILIPEALIEGEIDQLHNAARQQMAMQQGKQEPVDIDLPRDPYKESAKKRVALGLLLSEVIKIKEIKLDEALLVDYVKGLVEGHPNAEQMAEMYIGNKQLRPQLEAQVLEQQAVDKLLEDANITMKSDSYDAILNSAKEG